MGLVADIKHSTICLDTAPVIYYIEKNVKYLPSLNPLFQLIDSGELVAITTNITLLEVMVHPIRKGNRSLAESYRNILLHSDGFTTYEITHELAEYASGLRAEYNIRTPDAIQISAAILYGDGVLITRRLCKTVFLPNLFVIGILKSSHMINMLWF